MEGLNGARTESIAFVYNVGIDSSTAGAAEGRAAISAVAGEATKSQGLACGFTVCEMGHP